MLIIFSKVKIINVARWFYALSVSRSLTSAVPRSWGPMGSYGRRRRGAFGVEWRRVAATPPGLIPHCRALFGLRGCISNGGFQGGTRRSFFLIRLMASSTRAAAATASSKEKRYRDQGRNATRASRLSRSLQLCNLEVAEACD